MITVFAVVRGLRAGVVRKFDIVKCNPTQTTTIATFAIVSCIGRCLVWVLYTKCNTNKYKQVIQGVWQNRMDAFIDRIKPIDGTSAANRIGNTEIIGDFSDMTVRYTVRIVSSSKAKTELSQATTQETIPVMSVEIVKVSSYIQNVGLFSRNLYHMIMRSREKKNHLLPSFA